MYTGYVRDHLGASTVWFTPWKKGASYYETVHPNHRKTFRIHWWSCSNVVHCLWVISSQKWKL